jgi:hypothetical protein
MTADDPHSADQYAMLIESLQLAAAPADQQIAALPELVVRTDEVSSTFGDAFLLVPQLERAGRVSHDARLELEKLDELFAKTPASAGLDESLSHPFWDEARRLAESCLRKLGHERRALRLTRISWVEA